MVMAGVREGKKQGQQKLETRLVGGGSSNWGWPAGATHPTGTSPGTKRLEVVQLRHRVRDKETEW